LVDGAYDTSSPGASPASCLSDEQSARAAHDRGSGARRVVRV